MKPVIVISVLFLLATTGHAIQQTSKASVVDGNKECKIEVPSVTNPENCKEGSVSECHPEKTLPETALPVESPDSVHYRLPGKFYSISLFVI
jgi:hypothetical protein